MLKKGIFMTLLPVISGCGGSTPPVEKLGKVNLLGSEIQVADINKSYLVTSGKSYQIQTAFSNHGNDTNGYIGLEGDKLIIDTNVNCFDGVCPQYTGDRMELSLREWSDTNPVTSISSYEAEFSFSVDKIGFGLNSAINDVNNGWNIIFQHHQTTLSNHMYPAINLKLVGNDVGHRRLILENKIGNQGNIEINDILTDDMVLPNQNYDVKIAVNIPESTITYTLNNYTRHFNATTYAPKTSVVGSGSKLDSLGNELFDIRIGSYSSEHNSRYRMTFKDIYFRKDND